jgi:hypothetical protein
MIGGPPSSLPITFARLTGMSASPRTIQLRLAVLAVFSLAAGVLPWIAGGPLVAKLLGIPFLLVGLFAGYAAYRYPAVVAQARARTVAYPAEPVGGCACGVEGGCCGGVPQSEADVEVESTTQH